PALKEWFGMPVPEEYSKRLPAEDLMCWTDKAKKELEPEKLYQVIGKVGMGRVWEFDRELKRLGREEQPAKWRKEWLALLGNIEPVVNSKLIEGKAEDFTGGK